jgi:hypothetical protein
MGTKAKYTGPSKETEMLEVQAKILSEDDIQNFDSEEESTMNPMRTYLASSTTELISSSQKENNPRWNAYKNSAICEEHLGKASPELIVID